MTRTKQCANCGQAFEFERSTARFCRTECRVQWHRERKYQERREREQRARVQRTVERIWDEIDTLQRAIEACDNLTDDERIAQDGKLEHLAALALESKHRRTDFIEFQLDKLNGRYDIQRGLDWAERLTRNMRRGK
jgi:hypothetical protein